MRDIFDAKIICKNCNEEMKPIDIEQEGVHLRAVKCEKCNEEIIHPVDLDKFNHYKKMIGKTYNVKLRVVGNSHAISIPKEILDFIQETRNDMKKQMDEMVKLSFEDFGKLSLNFLGDDFFGRGIRNENEKIKEDI
jgi:hypothetical protein